MHLLLYRVKVSKPKFLSFFQILVKSSIKQCDFFDDICDGYELGCMSFVDDGWHYCLML